MNSTTTSDVLNIIFGYGLDIMHGKMYRSWQPPTYYFVT